MGGLSDLVRPPRAGKPTIRENPALAPAGTASHSPEPVLNPRAASCRLSLRVMASVEGKEQQHLEGKSCSDVSAGIPGSSATAATFISEGKAAAAAMCRACQHAHEPSERCPVCGHDGVVAQAGEHAPLLRRAVEFVYSALLNNFEPFYEAHLHLFANADAEHRLAYTDAHGAYCALLDEQMEVLVKREGFNCAADMYAVLRRAHDEGNERSVKMIRMINNAADFQAFVRAMKMRARRRGLMQNVQGPG